MNRPIQPQPDTTRCGSRHVCFMPSSDPAIFSACAVSISGSKQTRHRQSRHYPDSSVPVPRRESGAYHTPQLITDWMAPQTSAGLVFGYPATVALRPGVLLFWASGAGDELADLVGTSEGDFGQQAVCTRQSPTALHKTPHPRLRQPVNFDVDVSDRSCCAQKNTSSS